MQSCLSNLSSHNYEVKAFIRKNYYIICNDYAPNTWVYNYSIIYSWQYIFTDEYCDFSNPQFSDSVNHAPSDSVNHAFSILTEQKVAAIFIY